MKRWRKIVIFIMMLTLPISMWASVSMATHCQSSDDTSHSQHTQMVDRMSENKQEHNHESMFAQDSSEHKNCDCGCDGSTDCTVSGCSASFISNSMEFDVNYLTQSRFQQTQILAVPVNPNLLFRPPIIFS